MANTICLSNKILNSHSSWESGEERQQKEEKENENKDCGPRTKRRKHGILLLFFAWTHGPGSVPKCYKHYLIPPTIL